MESMRYRGTELAWAAGFLEGEGCFSITLALGRYLKFFVSAGQVEPAPLYRLHSSFGGHVNYTERKADPTRRGFYQWRLEGGIALREFLPVLIPYMTVGNKCDQAKFLLRAVNGVHTGRCHGQELTKKEIRDRVAMIDHLKAMKR
jgi:hypothetical protein